MRAPFSCGPLTEAALPLWCEAFSEEEADVRHMISLLAPDALFLFTKEHDVIVSQGILLPITRQGYKGYYLYALATAPAHRGRGYLSALLAYAKALARDKGREFLLLIPAGAALAEAYRRHGFTHSLPLSASVDGTRGKLPIPPEADERPAAEADIALAAAQAGLSPSYLRAVLFSMEWRLCASNDRLLLRDLENSTLCLLCIPSPYLPPTEGGECALCHFLHAPCLPVALADPLPR